MTEQERINSIVNMLDQFVRDGGGHMNVTVKDMDGQEQVTQSLSIDCCNINTPCNAPTLYQGLDDANEKKGE